ncbi:MAG: apolipoprotein N-acyltransferase [Gemmatimonadales bacterium]|nr:MAG: apolipoprotein N-acyltransferase [Gemmatimonadales bacterium]
MSAVLSGTLLFLAFLPHPSRFLVWVALVPWLVHVGRQAGGAAGVRQVARSGAVFFLVFWGLQLYWLLLLPLRLGVGWPVVAYLGQLFLLAVLGGSLGAAVHLLRLRLPLPIAAGVAWASVEWIRANLLGPLRFPWSPLGLPLVDWVPLIQPAAWVGETGLGLLVALVNGFLAAAWLARTAESGAPHLPTGGRWAASYRPLLAAGLLVGAWWAAGQYRTGSVQTERVLVAGAVQPAIPLAVKRDSLAGLEAARTSLAALLPQLEGAGAEVVVIPETHFPIAFPDTASVQGSGHGESTAVGLDSWLAGWSERLDAPVLLGGFGETRGGKENAVLVVGPQGVAARYGKIALVPGVEWTPRGTLIRGGPPLPLPVARRPGTLICIESAWASLGRAQAVQGAGWLLNVTNDAWLAGSRPWTRTPAFQQHAAHLVLRSVETGLGALRVGNTGWTGVVSPVGRWQPLIAPHVAGVAVAEIRGLSGATPYVLLGDLVGPLCVLVVLVGGVAALRATQRLQGAPSERSHPR